MQSDGNFAVYERLDRSLYETLYTEPVERFKFGTVQSAVYKTNKGAKWYATMQTDGNFVVCCNDTFKFGTVQTGKYETHSGAWEAVMQDDGNFVVRCNGQFKFGTQDAGS